MLSSNDIDIFTCRFNVFLSLTSMYFNSFFFFSTLNLQLPLFSFILNLVKQLSLIYYSYMGSVTILFNKFSELFKKTIKRFVKFLFSTSLNTNLSNTILLLGSTYSSLFLRAMLYYSLYLCEVESIKQFHNYLTNIKQYCLIALLLLFLLNYRCIQVLYDILQNLFKIITSF